MRELEYNELGIVSGGDDLPTAILVGTVIGIISGAIYIIKETIGLACYVAGKLQNNNKVHNNKVRMPIIMDAAHGYIDSSYLYSLEYQLMEYYGLLGCNH